MLRDRNYYPAIIQIAISWRELNGNRINQRIIIYNYIPTIFFCVSVANNTRRYVHVCACVAQCSPLRNKLLCKRLCPRCNVQCNAERGTVAAGFLSSRNRYETAYGTSLSPCLSFSLFSLSFSRRCTVATIARCALAHRNGSGNKLEGARECLSGIRGHGATGTKGRSAREAKLHRANGSRQRTNFTWTSSNDTPFACNSCAPLAPL